MFYLDLPGWEVLMIMLVSFAFVLLTFSSLDWGKIFRSGSKDKTVAIIVYVTISFAVSVLISLGIFMIISIQW